MLNKYLAYATAFVLALCLVLGLALKRSYEVQGQLSARAKGAEKALSDTQEQRKQDARLLATVRAQKGATGLQTRTATEALKRAQEASPDHSAAVVPPEVQSRLLEAVEGLQ